MVVANRSRQRDCMHKLISCLGKIDMAHHVVMQHIKPHSGQVKLLWADRLQYA